MGHFMEQTTDELLQAQSIATCLGQTTRWPEVLASVSLEQWDSFLFRHGIGPMIHHGQATKRQWQHWPVALAQHVKKQAQRLAVEETLNLEQLRLVLDAMAQADIKVVIFKGTALAYSRYPEPYLRPRCDHDIFVQEKDIQPCEAILTTLGYSKQQGLSTSVRHQATFDKCGPLGGSHMIDLHWQLSERTLFANVFSFASLHQSGLECTSLHHHPIIPNHADALLIACIHRAGHHQGSNRLIWLLDMHYLMHAMTGEDYKQFAAKATEHDLIAICNDAIQHIHSWSPWVYHQQWQELIKPGQPIHPFLQKEARQIHRVGADLKGKTTRERVSYIWHHLFPGERYMKDRYRIPRWCPWQAAYLLRMLRGTFFLGKKINRDKTED